jgi:hypothetical protein
MVAAWRKENSGPAAQGLAGGLGRMMRMNWFTRFGAAVRAS